MIEQNLVDSNIIANISTKYFAHYKNKVQGIYYDDQVPRSCLSNIEFTDIFSKYFYKRYKELSKNDWELHKNYVKEGYNHNEIAKVIRNDEIEKLQEIASQNKFDFNQKIEPSLYERCSLVNDNKVTLIDYAAYFSSVKCFKYLLIEGANIEKTGKYAVAGGNNEIIHLCEQNHSSFEDADKAAVMFHRNDIFKYLYENKMLKIKNLNYLGVICIFYNNYEILLFLIEKGLEIKNEHIDAAAENGNLYLVEYFLQNSQIPNDILSYSAKSGNIELVEYIIKQNGIDINAEDWKFKTALMNASEDGQKEIVKFLLDKKELILML